MKGTCPGATFGDGGCLGAGDVREVTTSKRKKVQHVCYFMRGHNSLRTYEGLYDVNSSSVSEDPKALGDGLDWAIRNKLGFEPGAKEVYLRKHVGGDYDSIRYIVSWIEVLKKRPWLKAWAYTHSWWVPKLLPYLEFLRSLPNFQLFASMDLALLRGNLFNPPRLPPPGWRVAWEDRDEIPPQLLVSAIQCPEMRDEKDKKFLPDCASCGYCFRNKPSPISLGTYPLSVVFRLHL